MEDIKNKINLMEVNPEVLRFMVIKLLSFMTDKQLKEVEKWLDDFKKEMDSGSKRKDKHL